MIYRILSRNDPSRDYYNAHLQVQLVDALNFLVNGVDNARDEMEADDLFTNQDANFMAILEHLMAYLNPENEFLAKIAP